MKFLALILISILVHDDALALDPKQARSTAISHIAVTLPAVRTQGSAQEKYWNIRRKAFQTALVSILNEKSYLTSTAINNEFLSTEDPETVARFLDKKEQDGLLILEIRNTLFRVSLRGPTGKFLAQWFHPTNAPLEKNEEVQLVKQITDSIIESFPYQGVVTKVGSGAVQINLGKKHNVQVGSVLNVYDYEGESPSFNSYKTYLGKIQVTKVGDKAAVAKPGRNTESIHSFAKVETIVSNQKKLQDTTERNQKGFFVGLGYHYMLLDSQTPSDNLSKQRRYRINLSPFYHLQTGYGPVNIGFTYGNTNSDSNFVTFMSGQLYYDFFEWPLGDTGAFALLGSGGVTYTDYKVTHQANPVITSFTTYSPFADFSLIYKLTGNTRFFGGMQLYYPTFSKDEVNGEGTPTTSYGFGFNGGLRVYVSPSVAFEGIIGSKYSNWVVAGRALQEIQFGTTFQGFYFF